jgi:hypothetical protein
MTQFATFSEVLVLFLLPLKIEPTGRSQRGIVAPQFVRGKLTAPNCLIVANSETIATHSIPSLDSQPPLPLESPLQ